MPESQRQSYDCNACVSSGDLAALALPRLSSDGTETTTDIRSLSLRLELEKQKTLQADAEAWRVNAEERKADEEVRKADAEARKVEVDSPRHGETTVEALEVASLNGISSQLISDGHAWRDTYIDIYICMYACLASVNCHICACFFLLTPSASSPHRSKNCCGDFDPTLHREHYESQIRQ
jgi:hypothetical protein